MFKNKKRMFILVLMIAIGLLAVSSTVMGSNRALVLNHIDGCTVFDLDWNLVPVEGNKSGDGVVTITQSANGNWSATCHGTLPDGSRLPKKAVIITVEDDPPGWFTWCGIPWLTPTYTRDMVTIIQPNGRVTLSCHYGPNSEGGTWEDWFGS
jgi:hypothetical protein